LKPPRIPESLLAQIREATPLAELVSRRVALKRKGAWHQGLCPFHNERNPSFAVHDAKQHFHCFGCGAHGDVFGWLMRTEGLSFIEAVHRLAGEAGLAARVSEAAAPAPWVPPPEPAKPRAKADDRSTDWAWNLWERALPIEPDGPVARYLAGRHLAPLPAACHAVLRQAQLKHPETGDERHPVMLARVDGPDGKLSAVHRTYLAPRPDGSVGKLPAVNAKLSLGALPGAAIRLFPPATRMGFAEGIETALAAHALTGERVWACISATILEIVQVPFDCAEAVVFADADKPQRWAPEGPGLRSAHLLADRLRKQAIKVEVRAPLAPHGDYADVWAARMAATPAHAEHA
jgi:DNA primase